MSENERRLFHALKHLMKCKAFGWPCPDAIEDAESILREYELAAASEKAVREARDK